MPLHVIMKYWCSHSRALHAFLHSSPAPRHWTQLSTRENEAQLTESLKNRVVISLWQPDVKCCHNTSNHNKFVNDGCHQLNYIMLIQHFTEVMHITEFTILTSLPTLIPICWLKLTVATLARDCTAWYFFKLTEMWLKLTNRGWHHYCLMLQWA